MGEVSDPQVTGYVVQLTDPDGHSTRSAGDVDTLIVPVTLLPSAPFDRRPRVELDRLRPF